MYITSWQCTYQVTGLNIKGCPTCPPRWNTGQGRYIMELTIGRAGKIPSWPAKKIVFSPELGDCSFHTLDRGATRIWRWTSHLMAHLVKVTSYLTIEGGHIRQALLHVSRPYWGRRQEALNSITLCFPECLQTHMPNQLSALLTPHWDCEMIPCINLKLGR